MNAFLVDAISPEFLLTALVVVLIPGTGVLYTLSVGIARGGRASVAAAFGCTVGILPSLAASLLGLAAVLHTSAVLFSIVKFAGVAYLLYLAWGMWRGSGAMAISSEHSDPDAEPVGMARIALRGALINTLNPKLSAFFLAFLPQFVPVAAPDTLARMSLLGAVFMALTFVVFVGYGFAADAIRRRVLASARLTAVIQRGFALCFAGFAVRLALASREG